jgi:hypothetical protein
MASPDMNPDATSRIDHALLLIATDPTVQPFLSLLRNMEALVKSDLSEAQKALDQINNMGGNPPAALIKPFEEIVRLHNKRIAELKEKWAELTPAIVDGMHVDGGFRGHKFRYRFKVGRGLEEWRGELEYGQWEWKEGCVRHGVKMMGEEWARKWAEEKEKEFPGALGKKRVSE